MRAVIVGGPRHGEPCDHDRPWIDIPEPVDVAYLPAIDDELPVSASMPKLVRFRRFKVALDPRFWLSETDLPRVMFVHPDLLDQNGRPAFAPARWNIAGRELIRKTQTREDKKR